MQKPFKSELQTIALAGQSEAIPLKNWSDGSVFIWNFGEPLITLACHTKEQTVFYEYVLPTFFTEDAVEFLLKLPNLYWFWTVLAETSQSTLNKTETDKITLEDILQVGKNKHGALTKKGVKLDKSVHVVSTPEACYWLEHGVVLLKEDNGQIVLQRNPLFELG